MTRPPDRDLLLPFDHEEKFDYDKIQNIVAALEYLRTEAKSTGCEEIYTLINSGFNICFTCIISFSGEAIWSPTKPDALSRVFKDLIKAAARSVDSPVASGPV